VPLDLSPVEARVLGALLEKDLATPEYYPLSLNALQNACNQKTNRDPVVAYDDDTVREGLEALRHREWIAFVHEAGSRVVKYRHRMPEVFNLSRGESALLALLLLRGSQTAAELRDRTARLHDFDDSEAVEHTLHKLSGREPDPLAALLPRQPGQKEQRWAHLLAGEPQLPSAAAPVETPVRAGGADLERRLGQVETQLAELRQEFESFKAQFE
jgi:uncharacterized protein YceH (UPF0502 family)